MYLQYSISYFEFDCIPDITKYTPFSENEYYYISDGIDQEYSITKDILLNSNWYIGYRQNSDYPYTQVLDTQYTYNSTNKSINISTTIPENYEVYISNYIIGSFDENLIHIEKSILSEGMNVPFTQEQVAKNSLLNQMVYGGTSKIYSQSNHISVVKDVFNNQYFNIVKGMISEYSYKAQKSRGLNGIKGLGGGLI